MHLSVRQVDCKNHLSECTIHLSEIYKANATYVKIRNTQSSVGQVLQVFHLSDCHFYSSQTIRRVKFRTLVRAAWPQVSSYYPSHCLPRVYFVTSIDAPQWVNTLRLIQNGPHFAVDIFKCIFLNENIWIEINISLKIVPKGSINNIPALVQIMAWRQPGDKPLSEPMLFSLLTHICVTRLQWVKGHCFAIWLSKLDGA